MVFDGFAVNKYTQQYQAGKEVAEKHLWLSAYLAEVKSGEVLNRADFNPFKIRPDVLTNLLSWDCVFDRGGLSDFRHRVFGQGLVDLMGFDLTGRLLSEVPFGFCNNYMFDFGRMCLETQKPVYTKTSLYFTDGFEAATEKSFYPVQRKDALSVLALITPVSITLGDTGFIERGEPDRVVDNYYILEDVDNWQDARRAA